MSSSVAPSIGFLADVDPAMGPAEIVELAREAEEAGFEGAWTLEYEYDSFAYDLAIALGTSRVVTGTAVARYYARHPLLCAESATVIDLLAPGRFIIGLGTGATKSILGAHPDSRVGQQRWGRPGERAIGRMREYIEIIRLALAEEEFSYTGEFFLLENVKLPVRPKSEIPIYLAAGGEQMMRLAGRIADGIFVAFVNEAGTKRTIEIAREAADKAGRDPEALKLGNTILTCVSDDREMARRAIRAYLVDYYLHLAHLQQSLLAEGFDEMEIIRGLAPSGNTRGTVEQILADERRRKAAEAVSDELLDEYTIAGTPAECRQKLEEFVAWGTDLPLLYVFPADGDWAAGYRTAIQAFAQASLPTA